MSAMDIRTKIFFELKHKNKIDYSAAKLIYNINYTMTLSKICRATKTKRIAPVDYVG
jgi:hypothetical protein